MRTAAILCVAASGYFLAAAAALSLTAERDYWRGAAAGAKARVGAACSPVYGVWWIERSCTGWAAYLPVKIQAVICPARIRAWRGGLEATHARAEALGPFTAALLLEERGPKERELPLRWRAEVGR